MATTSYHRGLTRDAIARAGIEIGFAELSVNAVAHHLKVSGAAIYRHVDGREDLETLVADRLLTPISCREPGGSMREYLIRFAQKIFSVCADNPGLADFLHTGFPRGQNARRIQAEAIGALEHWGIPRATGDLLAGTIAMIALSLSYADRKTRQSYDSHDDVLVAIGDGPPLTGMERFTLIIAPCIDGYLQLNLGGTRVDSALTEIYRSLPPSIAREMLQARHTYEETIHG